MTADVDWDEVAEQNQHWPEIASLERVEVYQATGMLIAQLRLGPAEALARLRAYAFAHDRTATEVAWDIVERRLSFDHDSGDQDSGQASGKD